MLKYLKKKFPGAIVEFTDNIFSPNRRNGLIARRQKDPDLVGTIEEEHLLTKRYLQNWRRERKGAKRNPTTALPKTKLRRGRR